MRPMLAVSTLAILAAACSGGSSDSTGGATTTVSRATDASTTTPSRSTDASAPTDPVPTSAATTPPSPATTAPPTPTSSEPIDTDPGEPVRVADGLRYHLDLEMAGCERMTTTTAVDAAAAAAYVDPANVIAETGGQSPFALSVLACDDLRTDDRSHGPGRFATAWIRLADDVEPELPAGSRVDVTGTDFYAPILFQTDNDEFAQATMDFGIPMMPASFEFEPTEAGVQHGSVEQTWTTPAASYEWQVDNVEIGSSPNHVGVHTLIGTSNTPELPLVYVGNFIHATSGFYGNQTSVAVPADSFLSPLLGDGFEARGNGDAVDVDMVVMRFDPVDAFEWQIGTETRAAGPDTRVRVRTPAGGCASELRPAVVGSIGVPEELVAMGNVVMDVQLVSEAPAALTPDKVADIARGSDQLGMAVAWLRDHADEYCVDPAAITVSGYSWSGIAALSLAYATGEFEVGDLIEVEELGTPAEMPDVEPLPVMPTLAGISTVPDGAIGFGSFAPPGTIEPGEPPSLLFNGTNDMSVPFALATATCAEAAAAGVECELVAHTEGHAFVPGDVDVAGIVDAFLHRL